MWKQSNPNQVWAIDITYIPMLHGYLYLTAVIDVHSRFISSWDISNTMDAT
ncbi:MAG: DDE-type integrase/transposase/recombinase [Saprospiraceae bacterium]|nr:DDE-type integrase/transposase/recombinase [Saprospiraceae bacterium]